MTKKIESKITSFRVKSSDTQENADQPQKDIMHEGLGRPDRLVGETYKIKPTNEEHAMYVTINDIVLNEGTEFEERRPYEMFINSKNMDHSMWIAALTRLVSAVFRKGGDVTFIVEEMRSIFDPRGGYYVPKEGFKNSIVAHIGDAIERHFEHIGLIQSARKTKAQKHAEGDAIEITQEPEAAEGELKNATYCKVCNAKAVVLRDGCPTCLECGDSKCG